MEKGFFIAIEGPDGCGKSTQIKKLKAFLEEKGYEVFLTREPGGTPIGEDIRKLLLLPREEALSPLTELLLFEAARAQHVEKVLRPALSEGKIVVASRYLDATVAYQHGGRGLPLDLVDQANRIGSAGLKTDLTIILDLDCALGLQRAAAAAGKDLPEGSLDRIESAGLSFHEKVRKAYLDLAAREKSRCVVVDGSGTVEEVFSSIARIVLGRLLDA